MTVQPAGLSPATSEPLATEPAAGGASRWPRWKRRVGYLGGAALGLVLLFGAYAKVLDPVGFEQQIRGEGLDFLLPASLLVLLALALEVGLGGSLVLGIRRLWVLLPAALLVGLFLFLTGRAYYRYTHGTLEEEAGCGCFGNLVDRTPAEAFWQDLLLLVPALLLSLVAWRASRALPKGRLALVLALVVASLGLALVAPELPLDDLATRLRPGRQVAELCAGAEETRICLATLLPFLEAAEHLVVLADLDAEFGATIDRLNELAFSHPSLVVLSAASPQEQHTFFWQYGPAFEIHEAPAALLRPLYRKLPRSFSVRDGVVVKTWDGIPEATAATGKAAPDEPRKAASFPQERQPL